MFHLGNIPAENMPAENASKTEFYRSTCGPNMLDFVYDHLSTLFTFRGFPRPEMWQAFLFFGRRTGHLVDL